MTRVVSPGRLRSIRCAYADAFAKRPASRTGQPWIKSGHDEQGDGEAAAMEAARPT
jgi:hypothetical protein